MPQYGRSLPHWYRVLPLFMGLVEVIGSGIRWDPNSGLSSYRNQSDFSKECGLLILPVIHCQKYLCQTLGDTLSPNLGLYICRIIMRNCLMWLWRSRSPMTCYLQAKFLTSRQKGTNPSFHCFLFYSDPQWIGQWRPTLGRTIYFTKSIDSNGNLIWKHPQRHTQKSCLMWVPQDPVKLTHKMNHHITCDKSVLSPSSIITRNL